MCSMVNDDLSGRNNSAATGKQHPAFRKQNKSKRAIACKFFATKQGCRAGESCPYLHDRATTIGTTSEARDIPATESVLPVIDVSASSLARREDGTSFDSPVLASPSRPVPGMPVARPIALQQKAHPRDFEITQLERRFSPTVREEENATLLVFKLIPSDPDFPFELNGLCVTLRVPKTYPSSGRPTIVVTNPEMDRGYQINVETGFEELVTRYPKKTLLALMNELDKNLESFLVSEKAKTIKLVANTAKVALQQDRLVPQPVVTHDIIKATVEPAAAKQTAQQIDEARLKRETEIRQIEARMGRQPLYSRSSDGISFNIPLQVPKVGRLPTALQDIKDIRLLVPARYPLESCNIRLKESTQEAKLVELAFENHATQNPQLTLMAHINNLVQNMHIMNRHVATSYKESDKEDNAQNSMQPSAVKPHVPQLESIIPRVLDENRPHVQVIARPPEWDLMATDSDEKDTDSTDSDFSGSEMEEDGGAELIPEDGGAANGPERGILLSFPLLELYSIELLQISLLSLTIKCDRCKDTTDVMGIKPAATDGISRNVELCKKCASTLGIAYRSEPMHMNSIRAGYLDLEGCTVVDMLPSQFQPTCSECSTTYGKPGVVSVRGETTLAICRECHKKMTFKLPEVKFLRISSAERPNRPLPRKRPKENLGIVAGTELPRKGRCQHYAKSYRWFRFSCCQKVYPCDRCHDAAEEHPNEHANRMICGLCSREQHYRPEDCSVCHSGLVGKKSGGFWEGGKGTRDKNRMSRKDPRKYKRRGGGAVSAKVK